MKVTQEKLRNRAALVLKTQAFGRRVMGCADLKGIMISHNVPPGASRLGRSWSGGPVIRPW